MVDACFALDIWLDFRTLASSSYGAGRISIEKRPPPVSYLCGFFIIYLVSTVPWEILIASSHSAGSLFQLLRVSKLIKLVRVLHVLKLFRLAKLRRVCPAKPHCSRKSSASRFRKVTLLPADCSRVITIL
jgi:hypothetical protein